MQHMQHIIIFACVAQLMILFRRKYRLETTMHTMLYCQLFASFARNVFPMRFVDPDKAVQLCVCHCLNKDITTRQR